MHYTGMFLDQAKIPGGNSVQAIQDRINYYYLSLDFIF